MLEKLTLEEKIGQMFMVNLELLDNSEGKYYEHKVFTKKMKKSLSTETKKYFFEKSLIFQGNLR